MDRYKNAMGDRGLLTVHAPTYSAGEFPQPYAPMTTHADGKVSGDSKERQMEI
jgi:hypothetical protein